MKPPHTPTEDRDTARYPRDECGVVGLVSNDEEAARSAFFALLALQHRGHESAGIACSDGRELRLHVGMGRVAEVFGERELAPLHGRLAIGHTRYSTTGASDLRHAQPFLRETQNGPIAVGHNGNLINQEALRSDLLRRGVALSSSSDSELILQLLASSAAADWVARIRDFEAQVSGAYSLVLMTREALYGVRDPLGMRPLCVGKVETEAGVSWVLASESVALQALGGTLIRELAPGEIVRLTAGAESFESFPSKQRARRAFCVFEFVYLSRPDSQIEDRNVHELRLRMGARLWQDAPAVGDVVVAIPDSARSAAIAYAAAAGIPYNEGLLKDRLIGRTFIEPDDAMRKLGVRLKYSPLRFPLEGQRVILVDDSIVRGNTAGPIIKMLRQVGATEVHMRVASPPVRHPCYMGVDMARPEDFVAAQRSVAEVAAHIGADSLGYLSLEGLSSSVNGPGQTPLGLCRACFSGCYPLELVHTRLRSSSS